MPWGGLCAPQALTRGWSQAWGAQVAAVKSCGKRAVDVPATAAAMGSQCLRGRAVSPPVRERSTLARLVERRKSGAKGGREVASSGRGSGRAFGTTGVVIQDKTTSRALREKTAEGIMRIRLPHN